MELSLATRTVANHTVLEVGGEVDVYTAPRLRERLVELVDAGARDIVVDLGRVDFLDSTGLGVLVGALKRLRAAGGTFAVVCAKEPLLKVFRITALDQVFPLHDTVEAAVGKGSTGKGSTGKDPTGNDPAGRGPTGKGTPAGGSGRPPSSPGTSAGPAQ